ncbi:hypothetical protein E9840_06685 [Tissierella creatinini]|nr:hypothetical protein E9840_06685 [Tissierella creatinini]TJX61889.1 hypothetical protein E8P77_17920 [Soehngenia saccharolytica]
MGRFEGQRIGLRESGTNRLIIAYPFTVTGSDEQIKRRVRTWFYLVTCSAECLLPNTFVDFLNEEEIEKYA